jgi:hypothetical protein
MQHCWGSLRSPPAYFQGDFLLSKRHYSLTRIALTTAKNAGAGPDTHDLDFQLRCRPAWLLGFTAFSGPGASGSTDDARRHRQSQAPHPPAHCQCALRLRPRGNRCESHRHGEQDYIIGIGGLPFGHHCAQATEVVLGHPAHIDGAFRRRNLIAQYPVGGV